MPHDVFISHSQKDQHTATAVCHTLEARGIRCWMAPRDIEPGKEWMLAIAEGLAAARVVVLVFSSRANESRHVAREVSIAFNEEIPIIPFRIEDVAPGTALKYAIGTTHWLDALTPPLEQHLAALADKVDALAVSQGERPRPVPPGTPSPVHTARAPFPFWAKASAAAAVIALAGVVALQMSTPESPGQAQEREIDSPVRTQPRPPASRPQPEASPAVARRPAPDAAKSEDSPTGVLAGYQATLGGSLRSAIKCTRVTMQERAGAAAQVENPSFQERARERMRLLDEAGQPHRDRTALWAHGLEFLEGLSDRPAYPFIVCHATRMQPGWSMANWRVWAAASEVQLGTASDALSVRASTSLSLEDIEAQEMARRLGERPPIDERQPFWYGFLLPATAGEVYASVVFRDGTRSDVVRVAIGQLNLGR
jgi:hypothetical protein